MCFQIGESSLYRMAEYFEDPETFKPERFDGKWVYERLDRDGWEEGGGVIVQWK